MAPMGPTTGRDDEAPTVSLRPHRPGPLGAVHARQLRWTPLARCGWWMFLLPLAIFAWSSCRLRGFPRAVGYVVAGVVLLFGAAAVSAPPPPPAPVAAPSPWVATTTAASPAAIPVPLPAPVPAALPVATPAPLPVTTPRPTATPRRVPPRAAYTTPSRPRATARIPSGGSTSGDTYTNVDGNQVQRPVAGSRPSGATAKCQDGTWSFSQHRSGTCSGHGGVADWL
jgi:hypothetical protein